MVSELRFYLESGRKICECCARKSNVKFPTQFVDSSLKWLDLVVVIFGLQYSMVTTVNFGKSE